MSHHLIEVKDLEYTYPDGTRVSQRHLFSHYAWRISSDYRG